MVCLVRNGRFLTDGVGVRRVNRTQYLFHIAEPDDGFVESCGQDDEGLGHVVSIFDGDPMELLRDFHAYSMAFYWTSDEA